MNKVAYFAIGLIIGSLLTFFLVNSAEDSEEKIDESNKTNLKRVSQDYTPELKKNRVDGDKIAVKVLSSENNTKKSRNNVLNTTIEESEKTIVDFEQNTKNVEGYVGEISKEENVNVLQNQLDSIRQDNPSILIYNESIKCEDSSCSLEFNENYFPVRRTSTSTVRRTSTLKNNTTQFTSTSTTVRRTSTLKNNTTQFTSTSTMFFNLEDFLYVTRVS